MHAASVHPEPGSNSRKMVYTTPCGDAILFFELDCSFTFCLSSILCGISEICSCTYFYASYFSHCCSIFNDRAVSHRSLSALADSLYIISQRFEFVNTFSKVFLKTFLGSLSHRALSALADSFIIIALCLFFVNCKF